MADKQYIVVTPLKVPGARKGTSVTIPPGKPIALSEEDAEPLLACGAIRAPDVILEAADKE